MADIKISELTALASTAIDVSADVFAVVDTSATQTKKLSVENVLAPIVINKASAIITNLGTVTTADINGGTWQGTIDGAWTAASQTCANLGTVTTADINGGTINGITNLSVVKASSGATATAGTVATFEDDDNAEISLLGGSSSLLAINFGHSGNADDGIITYNTTSGSEAMQFTTSGTLALTIDSSENIGVVTGSPGGYRLRVIGTATNQDAVYATANGSGRGVLGYSPSGKGGYFWSDSGIGCWVGDGGIQIENSTPILTFKDSDTSGVDFGGGIEFKDSAGTLRYSMKMVSGNAHLDLQSASKFIKLTTADGNGLVIDSTGNVGIGDTDPSEAKLSISGVLAGDVGIMVDQDQNAHGINIDCEAADYYGIYITGKYAGRFQQDISGGTALDITRNLSEGGSNPLVSIADDNTSNTQPALKIQQDGAGIGIHLDANGNENAIYIDHDGATSAECIKIVSPTQTTGYIISLNALDALTTGAAIQVDCGSANLVTSATGGLVEILHDSNTGSEVNNLLFIRNDHTSASGTRCLYIDQDASGFGIEIDMDGGNSCIKAASAANHYNLELDSEHGTYESAMALFKASARSSNSAFTFLSTYTGGDSDIQHKLRGDGAAYADETWNSDGADYAEYFESKDGKAIAIGTTVKLDGDKVVACESGDSPLGVVRPLGRSSNVGNNAWGKWQGKYLMDDYGLSVKEEYSVTEWESPDIDYEEGDELPEGKKIGDRKKNSEKHSYQTDKIPSVDDEGDALVVPEDATIVTTEKDGTKLMRKKLNPDYDESTEYEPRENRDEWHIVGLLGQIPITKGQPMADNWIKMKDISDTVEMYFVK